MKCVANCLLAVVAFLCVGISFIQAQAPVVNLGNDTTICSPSRTLNAGNPGATYLWSTGATSQTLVVTATGTYSVTATNANGSDVDSITITFSPTVLVNDTTLCAGNLTLTASGNALAYLWYDAATGGNLLSTSPALTWNATSSVTRWVEGWNGTTCSGMGRVTPAGGAYTSIASSSTAGLRLSTTNTILLERVTVFFRHTAAATATIRLVNQGTTTLACPTCSQNINLAANSTGGPNVISLSNFLVPPGTYDLVITNLSAGQIHSHLPCACFPFNYGCLNLVNGVFNQAISSNNYNTFFDIRASSLQCNSGRQDAVVTILPTPDANLGADAIICNTSHSLDATVPGSNLTYNWSTGATSPNITVTNSGTYTVTITQNGLCSDSDAIQVELYTPPSLASLPDSINQCNGTTYQWSDPSVSNILIYDVPTGGTPIRQLFGSWTHTVSQSDTLWIEGSNGLNCSGMGQTSAPGYTTVLGTTTYGLRLNLLRQLALKRVTVFFRHTAAATATIRLVNPGTTTLACPTCQQNITLAANAAGGPNLIDLSGFMVNAGTYDLIITNISAGTIGSQAACACFPFHYNCLSIVNGVYNQALLAGYYGVFYNIETEALSCSSPREPFIIRQLPTPDANLGADAIICNTSHSLDATVSGSNLTYNWSTGETSSNIIVTNSGTYTVTITQNGLCSDSDAIDLELYAAPDLTSLPDSIALCREDTLIWSNPTVSAFLVYDDSLSMVPIQQETNALHYILNQHDTIWVEGWTGLECAGMGQSSPGTNYTNIASTATYGLRLTVTESLFFKQVSIFYRHTAPATATIHLYHQGTTNLACANCSLPISLAANPAGGANVIDLSSFLVAPGAYDLVITNLSAGNIGSVANCACFPYTYDCMTITRGVYNGNPMDYYGVFYNIETLLLSCNSPRTPLILSPLPTPNLEHLPSDTTICGTSVTLDATDVLAGVNYLWTTGETTPVITVNSPTESVGVKATYNGCEDFKEVDVDFAPAVNPIVLANTDTTVCLGDVELWVAGNAQQYAVYDAANATLPIEMNSNGILNLNISQPDTFWVSGWTGIPRYGLGLPTNGVSISGGYGVYTTIPGGIQFDVLEYPIVLQEVTIFVEQVPAYATIELRGAANQLLNRSQVLFSSVGANIITLDYPIAVGNDYRLLLRDVVGSRIYNENNFTGFPIISPADEPAVQMDRGVGIAGRYEIFYNWNVLSLLCESPRERFIVDTLSTPILALPSDTIVCGTQVVLDASQTYSNAVYNWSNGATTPSITLTANDTVSVSVSVGSCSSQQTIGVILATPPSQVQPPNDTTICGGTLTLYASGDAYTHAWYNSETATTALGYGDSISLTVQDSTTIWVEGLGFVPHDGIFGLGTGVLGADGDYENIAASSHLTRGLVFDVLAPIALQQLSIWVDDPTTAVLKLTNEFGSVLYSQNLSLNTVGENVVVLNWLINAGYDYTISLENIVGGSVYVRSNPGYPLLQGDLIFRRGAPMVLSNQYPYFFDWRISTPSCATTRYPVEIRVPEYPQITLPADTAMCSPLFITLSAVDSLYPSYTYAWSTGETTPEITVSQSGLYQVTVTNDGLCSSSRDVFAQLLDVPAAPSMQDQTICTSDWLDLGNDAPGSISIWYHVPQAIQQYLSAPYPVYVADTMQFAVAAAARATTRLGLQTHPSPNNTGYYNNFIIPNTFDAFRFVVLDSVAVYVDDAPNTFEIVLENAAGTQIATKTVSVPVSREKYFVPLDFVIPPGLGYSLKLSNISTRFLVDMTPQTYPMGSGAGVVQLTGTSIPNVTYNCFYDWHFGYALDACGSAQDTFQVNVRLPLQLPDTTFACDTLRLDAYSPSVTSYAWSTGATGSSILVDDPGVYSVTISDGAGCVAMDTTRLGMPPAVGFPATGVNCGLLLDTDYSNTGSSFVWSTSDMTESINIGGLGWYWVTITTAPNSMGQGCVVRDSVLISQIEANPPVNLGFDSNACFEDSLNVGFSAPGYSYLWNTGETTASIVVQSSGLYSATVTSANGCVASDVVSVTITGLPTANFTYFNSGTAVNFVSQATGATAYEWIEGGVPFSFIPSPFRNFANTGCYDVTFIVYNGCGSDTITQTIAVGVDTSDCTTGVVALAPPTDWTLDIVPNPNYGDFQIWSSLPLDESARIEAYDLNGRLIDRLAWSNGMSRQNVSLRLVPGVYLVRLVSSYGIQTERVILLNND